MGYSVYKDGYIDRWAGYGVPAECDWPGCKVEIDRGLGFACESEEHTWCGIPPNGGLFFCQDHLYEEHPENIEPKPDSVEWVLHMLTDESWTQWRAENPERVALMEARFFPTP